MFYLKERVMAIEKIAMTAIPFRSVQSPPNDGEEATKFGQSMGAASVTSLQRH